MKSKQLIGIIGVLLLVGCTQPPQPQRPTQRRGAAPKVDSTALALLELNQQLTQTADDQLAYLAQQEGNFVLYERGTWVKTLAQGEGEVVQPGEECTVMMRVCRLDGQLLMDIEQTARIGKMELPAAVEENITEWHHGAHMILLAPWYAAYGIKGTPEIPPYENIRIELAIR